MGTTITEAQVLQFNLYVVQTEAVSQRRIEEVGLSGNLHLLVGTHTVQRAHVVHTVGELHQQSSDVVVDGVEHLLVVIHLLGDFVIARTFLGYDADQEGHVITETLTDVVDGVVGVFHHIVQESGNDRISTQLQLNGDDGSHGDGMDDIRFA